MTRAEVEDSVTIYKTFDIDTNEMKYVIASSISKEFIKLTYKRGVYLESFISRQIEKAKEQLIDSIMNDNKGDDEFERRED